MGGAADCLQNDGKKEGGNMNFDWTILHWIQNMLVCPAMDFLMPKITLLGNGGAVWILSAIGLLATKKYRKYGAFLLAGLAVGVLTGNLTLKPLIARPRPCWLDSSVQLLKPDGLLVPVRAHALVCHRRDGADEGKPEIWLSSNSARGAHRVFQALSLRPLPD